MPALPSPGKILRLDHIFTVGEDTKAKVRQFWSYLTGPPTASEVATIATAARSAFSGTLAPFLQSSRELTEVILTDLSSSTGNVGTDTTAVAGTRASAPLSADVCALESCKVNRRYRGGHPRMYWPFGVESDLGDVQTWHNSFVADLNAALFAYESDVAGEIGSILGGSEHVNVSFYEGFVVHTGTTGRAHNISTVRSTPVVDVIVDHHVPLGLAVQRKRLLRLA